MAILTKPKLKAAILGSGNIGCDLLAKIANSPCFTSSLMVGRHKDSKGINFARQFDIDIRTDGVSKALDDISVCDIIFDATSAESHYENMGNLSHLKNKIINLTPAKTGIACVPYVNSEMINAHNHINMVSCGGQVVLLILHGLAAFNRHINYIEVVSTISAKSAGPATRANIDEYINITQDAIYQMTQCQHAKSILIINPADPPIQMNVSISLMLDHYDLDAIHRSVLSCIKQIQSYVAKYRLVVEPMVRNNHIFMMVQVAGSGDYLPDYAGNLEIITSAALFVAEYYAKTRCPSHEDNHK